ncbi:hypothetical protein FHX15_005263 [Rhizobium sp. BK650]|uniref:hypothetical protein n=1 Tax=Rhizobium sp. BK650 TaxID=2586990 RepID=UPI001799F789|nr:hypothetical protein [Rhizobium sp. BK650]MBB3659994.1 hypothetical protein [Rhizobium sp. BK650]
MLGAAYAWGGNPDKDARYLNITAEKNDGTTIYKIKVKDVPVDGLWSTIDTASAPFLRIAARPRSQGVSVTSAYAEQAGAQRFRENPSESR